MQPTIASVVEFGPATAGALTQTLDIKQMKGRRTSCVIAALVAAKFVNPATAEMGVDERARIEAESESIGSALQAQDAPAAKHLVLRTAFAKSANAYVKKEILAMAESLGGNELEPFLLSVLQDSDVRLRIIAVDSISRHGTSNAIQPLLRCADNDPEGESGWGCVRSQVTARREACFALAEIGLRYPMARSEIAKALSDLPVKADDLNDSKIQALYVLTQDRTLITPFYDRLKNTDAKERTRGVVSFRLLKLNRAPNELVGLISDPSDDVRSWVALVLGEIGDTNTVPILLKAAQDPTLDRPTRCNAIHSLGQMHAKTAETALSELLNDESVSVNAAIALSRITGQRHPLVPQGYKIEKDNVQKSADGKMPESPQSPH
jgi:HEAT repeat protein